MEELEVILKNTESWNGTGWTEVADTVYSVESATGTGVSNAAGLLVGGYTGTATQATSEEWNVPVVATNSTITD